MRHRLHLSGVVPAALFVLALAGTAAAQTGRVGGVVKDEAGNPIKGATITAENPSASPSSFTATTDDKGRFSIIGLKSGTWTFSGQAPGYAPESGKMTVSTIGAPNPPLTLTLKKGGAPGPASALGGAAAKDLQADLAAADQLYKEMQSLPDSMTIDEARTRLADDVQAVKRTARALATESGCPEAMPDTNADTSSP